MKNCLEKRFINHSIFAFECLKKTYDNKTSKMKKNSISFIINIILIMMVFVSCDDALELTPESSLTSESFWQNEDDAVAAMNGMYYMFRSTFDLKSVFWGEFRTGYYGEGLSGGTSWDELWNNNLNATSVGVNWKEMYMLINDANLVLKHTPGIEFSDETEKNQVLGQAYFIRAFVYFQIVKTWGDAPIVTEGFESTDQEIYPTRNTKSEVFAQIKSDLDLTVSLLGESESVNYICITAAYMLMTDVYLWTAKLENGGDSDLQIALAAVDKVLGAGYVLEPYFETIFRDEGNTESIFSVHYSDTEPGDGSVNGASGRGTPTQPCKVALAGLAVTPTDLQDVIPVTSYPQWLDFSDYFLDNLLKPDSVDSRSAVSWQIANSTTGTSVSWINKYIGEIVAENRLPTSDLIIYRLAEAVLFKAEIENALGNTDEALTQLNVIAERAYGVDDYYAGLSSTEIDNAILDERILEFIFEGKAWYDIQRFGQSFERIPSLVGREGDNSGNILLWPIAQDVISRNTNIVQTDGY